MAGAGFFQGVRKDASVLGQTLAEMFAKLRDDAIPALYPSLTWAIAPSRATKRSSSSRPPI